MVEELKLAIKVDDDAIEQSLLKQFANAEKMANKVVLTFNNIDLDDKAIEAKFKEMQKMAGKNPIDLSIDKSSIEMLSAISKQLGNIFDIAKGKSIIDSSATISEIDKVTKATRELENAHKNVKNEFNTSTGLDSSISKYKEIVSLVKEYYELSNKLQKTSTKFQSRPEDYDRIDNYLLSKSTSQKVGHTDIEKDINKRYHEISKGINEGSDFAIKAMKSAIQRYWSNVTEMPSDESLLSSRKIVPYGNKRQKEEYIIPKKYQELEKSVIQETIAMNKNNASYEEERKQVEANNAALQERMNVIRNLIKSNPKNSDYDGEYRMGLSLKASDKNKADIFSMTNSMSYEDMLKEICNMLGVEIPQAAEKANKALSNVDGNKSNISSENLNSGNVDNVTNSLIEEQKAVGELDMVFRGLEGSLNGFMSNSGRLATFFTTSPLLARQYADSLGGVYQAMVALGKSLDINAEGRDWNAVEYLGDGSDEASRKIIELRKQIDNLYEQLNASGASGTGLDGLVEENRGDFSRMVQLYGDAGVEYNSYIEAVEKGNVIENQENQTVKQLMIQLYELEKAYRVISDAKDNVYGTHTTDEFAELAKVNGYDSVMFRNIKDSFDRTKNLTDVGVIFDESQIASVKNVSNIIDDLVQKIDGIKTQHGLNLPINIELPKEISRLSDGNFVNNLTGEIYDDVQKAIDSLKELDVQIESTSPIKDVFQGDAKVNTDTSTTAIKEESQALEQVSASAKDAATSKEKFANANKEVKASADETVISVDKEISALEKAGSKFESQAAGLAIKPDDQHQFSSWKNDLNELNAKIDEYKSKVENLSKTDIANEEQIKKAKTEIEDLGKSIKETINAMTKTPQTKRGWTDIGASKAAEKVANVLKQNTKMSKEATDAIRAYYNELRSGNPSQPIDEILVKVNQLVQKERELGRVGKSFGEIFKEKVIYGGAAQLAGMVGFYDVINVGREAFNVIKDLDSAYTEMRKVSDETAQSLKNFQSASFDVAKQVGVTALEIQNSAADFMRLGYSLKEASKLSEDANIYANVGDMDISEATEHMISSIQAWQSEFSSATEASTNIINRYNEIGNRFAITSADIGSAMERSAAALKAGGNDLNESIGIITAGNLIQQDADTTANAIKVLSLRLRGAKADLESMNEETDGLVESTSKMREQIQALTGVDIMIDDSTFKSTAKIIQEIGAEWSNLSDVSQAATLELLAGKTRASTVAGLIENYQTIGEVIEAAEESENSARIENEKYLDSMEGRLNLMTSQLQEMASVSLNDNLLKEGISALTKILELITDIVDTFGLLPTAAGIGGIVAGIKNVGQVKMWACLIYAYPC